MPVYKRINKDFFKKWTPEMAYILGFFAADGYITVNKRGGQFWCIDIIDKKFVEEIKSTIQAEHRISVRKRHKRKYTSYRLQIGSIDMCDDLRGLGYNERKTKNLSIPNVPDRHFPSFVKGYFDGDGNVWSGLVHKGRKTRTLVINTVFTSCSKKFLEQMRKRLEIYDVKRGVLKQGKGNYYRLTYSIFGSLKLYDFMYNDRDTSKLFLKRKKDVFEKYKKMRL